MSMLNALLNRGRGGAQQAPAAKRQRRADVLDDLGGGGGSSGSRGGLRSGLRLPVGGTSGVASKPAAAAGGVAKVAAKSAAEEIAAWALGASTCEKSVSTGLEAAKASAAPAPQEEPTKLDVDAKQAESGQSQVAAQEAGEAPAASEEHSDRKTSDGSEVADTAGSVSGKPTSQSAPARIDNFEDLTKGWRSRFTKAKDAWDVDEEGMRSLFWHSKTGCCFEWDQCAGMLYQYGEDEKSPSQLPKRLPIWSIACPDRHSWIWEQLPLPPTDPAASCPEEEVASEAAPADTGEHTATASGAASESADTSGGSAGESSAGDGSAASDAAATSASSDAVVNSTTIPCSGEDSGKKTVSSCINASASSTSSAAMPPPTGLPMSKKKKVGLEGALDAASSSSAASSASQPSASAKTPAQLLAELDDGSGFDVEDLRLGSLAEGDDAVALPAAPAERAKPQACDLDLDIFGMPLDSMDETD